MKQPWEWDEDDILSMIRDQVKESLELDYKSSADLQRDSDKKKDGISIAVASFANSAGGTLVYGIVEENRLPVRIDNGYDPTDITREWLEQVINSRIQRRIDGIRINQIELRTTQPGKVLYVVHVPQSTRAPHMASDKRFYRRFNFQSVPMEEYEVRDVSARASGPDLHLHMEFLRVGMTPPITFLTPDDEYSQAVPIRIYVGNDNPTPAQFMVIRVFFDTRLQVSEFAGQIPKPIVNLERITGEVVTAQFLNLNRGQDFLPVWQGNNFEVMTQSIGVPRPVDNYFIEWQISSPHMALKRGCTLIVSGGDMIRLQKQGN